MNILSVKYDFLVDVGKFRLARKALVVEYETLDYSYGSFLYALFFNNGLLNQKIGFGSETQVRRSSLKSSLA